MFSTQSCKHRMATYRAFAPINSKGADTTCNRKLKAEDLQIDGNPDYRTVGHEINCRTRKEEALPNPESVSEEKNGEKTAKNEMDVSL